LFFDVQKVDANKIQEMAGIMNCMNLFVQAVIDDNGGVAYAGNASASNLGSLVSLSPEAQSYIRDQHKIDGESMWRFATEVYGDGPFGEGHIGSCWSFGSGNPMGGEEIGVPILNRMKRLLNSLSADVQSSVLLYLRTPREQSYSFMHCPNCRTELA
jgi:hypothetical protein